MTIDRISTTANTEIAMSAGMALMNQSHKAAH